MDKLWITSTDTTSVLTSLATVLTLAVVYYHVKLFTFWSSRGVKGPLPVPIFGTNIYYIFRDRSIVDFEFREKYGHIYGLYEGYEPVLRVTDNEIIKHVWIKNFASFTDRNWKPINGDNAKRWLLWSRGEHWNNQRVLISPMFTSSRMKTMFNITSNCVKHFTNEVANRQKAIATSVLQYVEDKSDPKILANALTKAVDLATFSKDEFMALALDVIAQGFFSIKLNTYRDKTSEFFKRAYAFSRFDMFWFVVWMVIPAPIRHYFKLDLLKNSQFEYFEKLSQSSMDERRSDSSKRKNDFIQALIEAKLPDLNDSNGKQESLYNADDDAESHYNDNLKFQELESIHESSKSKSIKFRSFDDQEIRSHMTFFFLAGFETSSASLTFCFYELAHQQDAQLTVYQELIDSGFSQDKQPDYTELLALKRLDAFISECLRLYSPVTENNRMVTNKNGVTLPTEPPIQLPHKCIISNPSFVYQRDPDYWENPTQFDMTRFYPENKHKIMTSTYLPFGLGPRNCAGMRFALLTLKLSLASILLKYHVIPGPKSQTYPPEFKRHNFFLQLKHSDVRLVPREADAELGYNNLATA